MSEITDSLLEQAVIQHHTDQTDSAIGRLIDRGYNSNIIGSIPEINTLLPPAGILRDIWEMWGGRVGIELIGMPGMGKTVFAVEAIKSRAYRVMQFSALVKSAFSTALMYEDVRRVLEMCEWNKPDILEGIRAHCFFDLMRQKLGIPQPILLTINARPNLPYLIPILHPAFLELEWEKEKPPLNEIKYLLIECGFPLETLSIREEQMILDMLDVACGQHVVDNFIETYLIIPKGFDSKELCRRTSNFLSLALKERATFQLAQDFPVSLFDEDFFSFLTYRVAMALSGKLPAIDLVQADHMSEPYPYRLAGIDTNIMPIFFSYPRALILFLGNPEISMERKGKSDGWVLNPDFLSTVFNQFLRIYEYFLHDPNRPIAVAAVDASGSKEQTRANFYQVLDKIELMAGSD